MKHFKILPLMIIVAMLAFSLRLAEVISGVSNFSGAAYAENASSQKEKRKLPPPKGGLTFAQENDDKTENDDNAEKTSEEKKTKIEDVENDVDWRDATEEDISYTNIRMKIFDDLSKRRKKIENKEKELITREALLKAVEREINQKNQELSQLRTEIEQLLETQSKEEENQILSLVKIYEGMKPKDAARIFDTLDLDVLVAVMSRMSERKLSPILAKMNPERARTVTIMLIEQKQLPSMPSVN